LRNDGGSTTVQPVVSGEVDIGLGFNIPATPGIRTLANFDIPLGAVLPSGHRLAAKERVSLAEMVEEPLVLAQPGTSLREVINLALAPLPVPIEPILETNSSEMLKQMVRLGTGLSLLNPLDVLSECRRGELIYRPLADPYVRHQPMKLFTRARAPLDAATNVFVEFLLGELIEIVREVQGRAAPAIDQRE
jgi:DNA-binding transcriptional LysR family regulator